MTKKSPKQKKTQTKVIPSNGSEYFKSIENTEIIEYVRCRLTDAHILQVPDVRPDYGWSATELKEEIWQGTVKIVDRSDLSAILLVDKVSSEVVAVCPIGGADSVERCVDSSRYFVLRVNDDSDNGSIKYIGLAFNERTAAFDFNVALETSRKEKFSLLQIDQPVVVDEPEKVLVETEPRGDLENKTKKKRQAASTSPFGLPTFQFGKQPGLLKPSRNDNQASASNRKRKITASEVPQEKFEPFADFSSLQGVDEAAPTPKEEGCR